MFVKLESAMNFLNKIIFIFFLLVSVGFSRKLAYVEEFYRLYYLPLSYNEDDLHRNVFWLQIALKAPFSPPIQALWIAKTKKQYEKYCVLMKMHIHYLMVKNLVYMAARFDKHQLAFHDKPFKKEILESLAVARYYYQFGLVYWGQVIEFQKESREVGLKIRVDLDFLNDLAFRVRTRELDYKRIITRKILELEKKITFYEDL